jgi:DNA-3-methyladenine glycosylase
MNRLTREFFTQHAVEVAQKVLGKYLVHKIGKIKLVGKIVETEAYVGPEDKASHGYKNRITKRNRAEFMIGGHIYIYLCYGMYWQLNISTGKEGVPECFLIRALEPIEGIEYMKMYRKTNDIMNLTNGPGKLCIAMKIDKSHYGLDITKSDEIYIEDRGDVILPHQIVKTKRIGIDYAGEWKNKLLRFYIKDNKFVSKI